MKPVVAVGAVATFFGLLFPNCSSAQSDEIRRYAPTDAQLAELVYTGPGYYRDRPDLIALGIYGGDKAANFHLNGPGGYLPHNFTQLVFDAVYSGPLDLSDILPEYPNKAVRKDCEKRAKSKRMDYVGSFAKWEAKDKLAKRNKKYKACQIQLEALSRDALVSQALERPYFLFGKASQGRYRGDGTDSAFFLWGAYGRGILESHPVLALKLAEYLRKGGNEYATPYRDRADDIEARVEAMPLGRFETLPLDNGAFAPPSRSDLLSLRDAETRPVVKAAIVDILEGRQRSLASAATGTDKSLATALGSEGLARGPFAAPICIAAYETLRRAKADGRFPIAKTAEAWASVQRARQVSGDESCPDLPVGLSDAQGQRIAKAEGARSLRVRGIESGAFPLSDCYSAAVEYDFNLRKAGTSYYTSNGSLQEIELLNPVELTREEKQWMERWGGMLADGAPPVCDARPERLVKRSQGRVALDAEFARRREEAERARLNYVPPYTFSDFLGDVASAMEAQNEACMQAFETYACYVR